MIQALLYSIQFKQKFIILLILRFIFYLGSKYLLPSLKSAWVNFTYPKSKHITKSFMSTKHMTKSLMSIKHMAIYVIYGAGASIVGPQECTALGKHHNIRGNTLSPLYEGGYTKLAEGVLLTSKGHVTVIKDVIDIPSDTARTLTIFTKPEGTITNTISRTAGQILPQIDSTCPATTPAPTVTSMITATVTKTVTETLTSSPSPINTSECANCEYKNVLGWLGGVLVLVGHQWMDGCNLVTIPGTLEFAACHDISDSALSLTGSVFVNYVSKCHPNIITGLASGSVIVTQVATIYLTRKLQNLGVEMEPFKPLEGTIVKSYIDSERSSNLKREYFKKSGSFLLNCLANQVQ